MPTISEIKEQVVTQTPLILFDCVLPDGEEKHWSTHKVVHSGKTYLPRVLRHNLFESRTGSDEGIDAVSKLSLTLANADSQFSQIEHNAGFRGARLTATFLFFDLRLGQAASEGMVLFRGIANAAEDITEDYLRVSFTNRLSLQRMLLPDIRIQRRCPWTFPATVEQRQEAVDGGDRGKYSPFFRCGYSADLTGGLGSLNGTAPYTSCDYTRASCEQRGMFNQDSQSRPTRRFGGIEFVPASILVRGQGEKGLRESPVIDNQARYNDFVPLNYGTVWMQPLIVYSRNDGNLTRMEVLLGAGEINRVVKVVVNGIDIPQGVSGQNMTSTGWFNTVTHGELTGGFNLDFTDGSGQPLGDPYGSMAYMSVVVPNRVNDGGALPRISVLMEGLKLPHYGLDGNFQQDSFTNNPAWVILDLLRRSGWKADEMNLASFAKAAAHCAELISVSDLFGNAVQAPRYQCNLGVRRRKSAADLIRGIRNGAGLYLVYGANGLLELRVEATLAMQQPVKPGGSNSTAALNGGWPAYEFGDGSSSFSGILRRGNGESSVRVWSRGTHETANRYSLEFQDQFNEYQQDSLSLIDVEDAVAIGQEVSLTYPAYGIPNFHQAARILQRQLDKSIEGNLYVQFETSAKGVGLKPGDLITLTYLKEGFVRKLFRIIRLAPGLNHRDMVIEAQAHLDSWYTDMIGGGSRVSRRQPNGDNSVPRPLLGSELDASQQPQYGVVENIQVNSDGGVSLSLTVSFTPPEKQTDNSLGIPYVSLSPATSSTGGTLIGGSVHYYAASAVNSQGGEGPLSFIVRAAIPSGTNTNKVVLQDLRFSPGTASFRVYRGESPEQLLRIASGVAPAALFEDTGLAATLSGPPDVNFDHARFEWRLELSPETTATVFSMDTIGAGSLQLIPDEYAGMAVRITSGKGKGQEREIQSHTANTITVRRKWDVAPDATSKFVIAESSWRFGAAGKTTPIQFDVPNREGATVHVSGRAVSAQGRESARDLSPVTRWRIVGATGGSADQDVPPPPTYAFSPKGRGIIEVGGIGFTDLTNTRTITAGTLTLHYWEELSSPTSFSLSTAMDSATTQLVLASAGGGQAGDLVQVKKEILEIQQVTGGGTTYTVLRGSHGSAPVAHVAGTAVYHLKRKVFIIPLSRDFFGSPASGSYSYPILLPNIRLAAADLMMTNSRGNSETSKVAVTGTVENGLRTLSGGQLAIQVEGFLAIQTNAAPPLVVETARSVLDVFAVVGEAPTGAPIELTLKKDGLPYANLVIPAGATISNIVDGFGLLPLAAMARLTLDVTSVGQTFTTTSGRDLTVTIRC
ncbi:MAG: hypothetical protein FJW20_02440 [Acidimicrobiia bacterium]|nr:hypothetical protein [Acidimicrobiia bacterium]